MEVKDFLRGLPSLTKIPPIQTLPKPLNPTLPNTYTPPFSIQPHPFKLVSFQTHLRFPPTTPKVGTFWRFKCVNKEGFLKEEEVNVRRKRLAVFVSGGGSNFKSIHEACVEGMVRGDVVVLVTNKRECGGAEFARNRGISVILFPKTKDEPDGLTPNDLVDALRNFDVDFILLAGYLKLIPTELIRAFPRSIVNIHPSLLPAFGGKGYYGVKVHKAVIASGARYSGPTIHFVDEHYDMGRILAQRVVPVLANDTVEELAARVLQEEHRLYVDVTMALCDERIIWREDGVPLIRSRENPNEYT